MVGIRLQGSEFGPFDGAIVETPVDTHVSETETFQAQDRLAGNMSRLIRDGRVRFNPPGYQMQQQDWFDAQRRPWAGVGEWRDNQLYIVRPKLATSH
jgi:hypothetical protein